MGNKVPRGDGRGGKGIRRGGCLAAHCALGQDRPVQYIPRRLAGPRCRPHFVRRQPLPARHPLSGTASSLGATVGDKAGAALPPAASPLSSPWSAQHLSAPLRARQSNRSPTPSPPRAAYSPRGPRRQGRRCRRRRARPERAAGTRAGGRAGRDDGGAARARAGLEQRASTSGGPGGSSGDATVS